MKLFIDTAEVEEIREAASWGILDGVTTNPSLVARTGRDFESVIHEICEIVDGPVNAEAVSVEASGMIVEGKQLAAMHPNVFVKIPMTAEGLKACKALSDHGVRTNVTLVFSAAQALLAAKAGAAFISPFVGRLDDAGHDGMAVIDQIVTILRNYAYPSEVLVASVRNPGHVIQAAEMGAHIATCPFNVLKQLLRHPLTDVGIERFLADWERVPKP
jgi:transaldolase